MWDCGQSKKYIQRFVQDNYFRIHSVSTMKIFRSISELQNERRQLQANNVSVGFVPTMGALHEGHISLIRKSISENEVTVCSIFVNPAQFNNPDDLAKYPRAEASDILMLEENKCDIVFIPTVQEMYPADELLNINFGFLETTMEGAFRPGHFKGVATVVKKLFDLVAPAAAYFGEKDFQQLVIIKKLAEQLNPGIKITACKTVRDEKGLALSSRNVHLTLKERKNAFTIYQALLLAQELFYAGFRIDKIKEQVRKYVKTKTPFRLQYFEIVNELTLEPLLENRQDIPARACIAVLASKTRLLDNMPLRAVMRN